MNPLDQPGIPLMTLEVCLDGLIWGLTVLFVGIAKVMVKERRGAVIVAVLRLVA
jgi:hypothetical protein